MSIIRNFPRYSTKENIVTNNVMLLLGRIYKIDPALFERFMVSVLELDALQIGPTFNQQSSSGGEGIPDAMIFQPNFRIVVEAKLTDDVFWGKERYTSHFHNENSRILLTVSKKKITEPRMGEFTTALAEYDREKGGVGNTIHRHLTYVALVDGIRQTVETSRTRYKIEIDELTDDFEGFLSELGLIDDEHLRMHVVPVGQTHDQNLEHSLYYNQTAINYSAHKFIGLYYWKEVRFVGEPKVVLIPHRQEDGSFQYTFQKGEEHFTAQRRATFEEFLNEFVADEGHGDDGGLRYHLVDQWHPTHFLKESAGGIMGPRHCFLPDYIENITQTSTADEIASKLNGKIWDVG